MSTIEDLISLINRLLQENAMLAQKGKELLERIKRLEEAVPESKEE